jgi:uncharacterized protein YjdB
MRLHPALLVPVIAITLAACDQATAPRVASLGGTVSTPGGTTTSGGSSSLAISPNRVLLVVGQTFQLTTNAPAARQNQVSWTSQASTIAAVSPAGLVTALSPGTATIVARLSSDTNQAAAATVTVTP